MHSAWGRAHCRHTLTSSCSATQQISGEWALLVAPYHQVAKSLVLWLSGGGEGLFLNFKLNSSSSGVPCVTALSLLEELTVTQVAGPPHGSGGEPASPALAVFVAGHSKINSRLGTGGA